MSLPKPSNDRYNTIGGGYDETRKADPFLAERMHALLEPKSEQDTFAEIGCGTGNYTIALHQMGLSMIGVEPSLNMIEKARQKNQNISWIQGAAESIPLDDSSVNGVLLCLTIHHWKDLGAGMLEISRVLKPGGRLVLFTTLPEQTKAYWLNHYFPKMIDDSIAILPTKSEIERAYEMAGLNILHREPYDVKPDLKDQFLFCGKHNPRLYFDQNIRRGISSFSLLAYREEVNAGLAQLQSDIDSGRFTEVQRKHETTLGDYLFVVGEKSPST